MPRACERQAVGTTASTTAPGPRLDYRRLVFNLRPPGSSADCSKRHGFWFFFGTKCRFWSGSCRISRSALVARWVFEDGFHSDFPVRQPARPMKTDGGRICPSCGNEFSGAVEFCPVCMLREALAGGGESGESSAEQDCAETTPTRAPHRDLTIMKW